MPNNRKRRTRSPTGGPDKTPAYWRARFNFFAHPEDETSGLSDVDAWRKWGRQELDAGRGAAYLKYYGPPENPKEPPRVR